MSGISSDDLPIETKKESPSTSSFVGHLAKANKHQKLATFVKKRKTARGLNYSAGDMILLTSLLSKYKRFILAKCKTYMDVATKAEAWKQFSTEYNATAEVKRTMKTLQTKVKNMKTRGTHDISQLAALTIGKELPPVDPHVRKSLRSTTTKAKETAVTGASSSKTTEPVIIEPPLVKIKLPCLAESDDDSSGESDEDESDDGIVENGGIDSEMSPVITASPLPKRSVVDDEKSCPAKNPKFVEEEHEAKMDVLDLKKSNLMLERCLLQQEHEEKMAILALKKRKLEMQNSLLSGKSDSASYGFQWSSIEKL